MTNLSNENMKYFEAMKLFLEKCWELRGKSIDSDLAGILSSLESEGGKVTPRDIAMWNDWVESVERVGWHD